MREGWEDKLLKDICSIFGRIGFRGYTKADFVSTPDNGAITLSPSNIIGGELSCDKCSYVSWEKYYQSPEIMVFPGDILLVKTASIGKCALVRSLPHEATINPQFVVLKEIKVNHQYLTYFLQSPIAQKKFQEFAIGAAVPTFSQKKLEGLIVPTPSLPEQQRIVDILDREFAKIDALKANAEKSLQAAKDLFQATLKKELEPKEGWAVAEIGSVCLKTDNIKWRDIPEDKEYTYIDLTSVDRSTKSIVEPQRIKKSNAPSRAQRLVCEDDIIFATTRPTLRRYCLIPEQYDGQICSTGFCVLRPDKRKVRPSWLFHCLSTDAFYDYVEPLQTGATYPAISDKDVKSYTISLPTITEQDDIVSRLNDLNDKCNTLQQNYQKTLTLCDDLKQSLLRKAFSGEL